MNRAEEYKEMLCQLKKEPQALSSTVQRAFARKRRNTARWVRGISSAAACIVLFVALVNFSVPVAYACSRIPVLKDLAAAVTFSRSLTDAVENEYVQPMDLIQQQGDVTAKVEYLIVDQKQVNIFYRLQWEGEYALSADPQILTADGAFPEECIISSGSFTDENAVVRQVSVDFQEGNVPDALQLQLRVYDNSSRPQKNAAPENAAVDALLQTPEARPESQDLASFTFKLQFDPLFTAAGKTLNVDRQVTLNGQKLTVTEVLILPTHIRVEIAEDPGNTAWLKDLEFYVETDWGMRFEPVTNGITATGSADTPSIMSYRADSSYFHEANRLKLVFTGARWLPKDQAELFVDLAEGTTDPLPQGVELVEAKRQGSSWLLCFRAPYVEDAPMRQLFGNDYRDPEGNSYTIRSWSTIHDDPDGDGKITHYQEQFALVDYPYDTVWLEPVYAPLTPAEPPIELPVQ